MDVLRQALNNDVFVDVNFSFFVGQVYKLDLRLYLLLSTGCHRVINGRFITRTCQKTNAHK